MGKTAEAFVLAIFEKCAGESGCDVCRLHMEDDCLFFPELYRLQDQADASGVPLNPGDFKNLIDLCTMCELCPCQDIKMLILKAKAAFAREQGISLSSRFISDVGTVGRWGACFSKVVNPLIGAKPVAPLLKKALKIHPERPLPVFPKQSFFSWAEKKGLTVPTAGNDRVKSKVAYFAGCSAGYLYPDVGKAAVKLLEQNGIAVFVPPQQCCGMPLIMEGNRTSALKKINANVEALLGAVHQGYDIVCSCPTCGYFFKKMLLEKAHYSKDFQEKSGGDARLMKIPLGAGKKRFTTVSKGAYRKLLKDDGYFSSIDPLKRIELSERVKDMGEYLLSLRDQGRLEARRTLGDLSMIYYAPCHQREQEIGQPYYQLFKSFSGSDIIQVTGAMQCCGMGGHLGYKTNSYSNSLDIGRPLFEQLLSENARTIVTDCLSCKIQIEQALSRAVVHPLELLL